MEMQGTPIGSTNQGMKNTSDPERYNNPTTEGAGSVASDSLAAESARSGGKFGENRDSQPHKESGSASTSKDTDISSATELPPAPNAAEREAKAAWEETSDKSKGPGGQKYPEGTDGQSDIQPQPMDGKPASGLRGVTGPSASMGSTGGQQTSGSDAKSGPTENTFKGEGSSDVDAAPGYIGSFASDPARTGKPKGKKITEGGFDEGDDQNTSFTSEIGDENDPGRKAENDMQRMTQSSSGSSAPRQKMGESGDNKFGDLSTNQNLYLNDVKNAPKERAKLSLEAANLLPLLDTLRDQVENADPNDPWLESVLELGGSGGPLDLFRQTMDQLKRKLKTESPMSRLGKHLVWTLSKDDIQQILAHIERFKTRLILALQKDNMKLSRAIKTDTAAIEPIGKRVETISNNLDSLSTGMCAQSSSTFLEKVLLWLSPVEFQKHHDSAREDRVEGTGQWFLSSPEFIFWRDNAEKTLFCPGIPGGGKTIIASLVIDHLSTTFSNDKSTIVLYLYCFYKDRSQQSVTSVTAVLLKQLIRALDYVPDQIKDLYESSMRDHSRPKQGDLSNMLREELQRPEKVFVVVDALDEYSDSEAAQRTLLDELLLLRGMMNLMVTSRPVSLFIDAFDEAIHITVTADNADVRRYLTSQMSSLSRCVRNKPDLQERIVQTITGAVEGMFLLARLHVRSLVDKLNTRQVEEALKALPRGSGLAALDFTYDETIERIKSQEKGFCDLAFTILSWISLAKRPLTVTELLHALSIEPGDTAIDEENFVDEDMLTFVCAGFVVIDGGNGSIRLAHYTMQEYFDCREYDLFNDAETDIAMTCITYLMFDVFSTYTQNDLEDLGRSRNKAAARLEVHPLLDYASNYCANHLVHSDRRAARDLCVKFLGCHVNLAASMATSVSLGTEDFFDLHDWIVPENGNRVYPDDVHGLWVAAKFGLHGIVREFLDTDGGFTPTDYRRASDTLCVAVCYNIMGIAELLIEKTEGTIVVAERSHALHCAVRSGNELCVSILLKAGPDVNSNVDCLDCTPLEYAASLEGATSVKILEMLLAAGADVNGKREVPLNCAVSCNNVDAALILLKNGADTAKHRDTSDTSVLAEAVDRNAVDMVDLLLRFDADVSWRKTWDGESRNGPTVLHYVRSPIIVSQLIKYGADVNAADVLGWTLLHTMADPERLSCHCYLHIAQNIGDARYDIAALLIEKGASIDKAGCNGFTPLHCAVESGDVKFIRLLLASGADVDARDDRGYPALLYAHKSFPYWRVPARDQHFQKDFDILVAMKALLVEYGADPRALANELTAMGSNLDSLYDTGIVERYMPVEDCLKTRDAIVRFLLDTSVTEDLAVVAATGCEPRP